MKKQLYFTVILLMLTLVLLVGCHSNQSMNSPAVKVGDVIITNQQVEDRLQYTQILDRIYQTWLPQAYGENIPDAVQKETALATDRDAVLKQMIRYEVVNQYREKNGRLYGETEAKQEAERNLQSLRKDALYEQALQESLAYYNLSTEDFLALSYSVTYDTYNYSTEESLYKTENWQIATDDTALTQSFETFVDQLVEQTEVEYF